MLLLLAPGCLLVSLLVVPLVVASLIVTSLVVATSLSPTRAVSLVPPTLLGLGLPLDFYIAVASSLKRVRMGELTFNSLNSLQKLLCSIDSQTLVVVVLATKRAQR